MISVPTTYTWGFQKRRPEKKESYKSTYENYHTDLLAESLHEEDKTHHGTTVTF